MFSQVRRALTRKHFTKTELQSAFQNALMRFQNGEYEFLGVIMRLLTGLESNIICGLKWKDIVWIEDYGFSKLMIIRQVLNDGSEYVGFNSLEDYRCFPCSALLQPILDEMRRNTESVFQSQPLDEVLVITTSESLKQSPSVMKPYPPCRMDRLCKEVLEAVGIQDRIVTIPDQDKGTKETNLNHYGGDFYRENFRYWIMNAAKMTGDEAMYLMGNKAVTTFGKHYCDYLNDASQLAMRIKLQRWDAVFLKNINETVQFRKWEKPQMRFENTFSSNGNPLHIQMSVKAVNAPAHIHVSVESDNGLSVYAAPMVLMEGGE